MSFDPDDDRWAARAAEVAGSTMTVATSATGMTFRFRVGEFMNPWHDEIGRFAPKGTGTMSLPDGYTQTGPNSYTREVEIPRSFADGQAVMAAMALFSAVHGESHPVEQRAMLHGLIAASENVSDPLLVENYLKPAARALGEHDFEEAHRLISEADAQVFTPFTEEFEVADLEPVPTDFDEDSQAHFTVTPEGHVIALHGYGHNMTDEQVQTILATATAAARAGNVKQDVNIIIQAAWDRDTMSRETNVMGFVNVDPDGNTNRHRTIQLTPELIEGNFDPGAVMDRTGQPLTAGSALVSALRATVSHEMGHVSIFETALNKPAPDGIQTVSRGEEGQTWFNDQMEAVAANTPREDIPFMSAYAQQNTVEMHAEAFQEWTITGGKTNNPWVNRLAQQFGWSGVTPAEEDLPLAAAGAPPSEPWVPIFYYPTEPVTLVDGPFEASYKYGPPVEAPLVATIGEFMNPWHDEIGRFAPKGTGTQFDAKSAASDIENGRPVTATGAEALDIALELAKLYHPVDLTLLTVDGSPHMFSEMREKGRKRIDMPQIPTKFHNDFAAHLGEMGFTLTPETIDPRDLHATQSELDGQAVGNMMRNVREGTFHYGAKPLVVSSDNRILDGHHRWAAAAIESAACDGCIELPIVRVNVPMKQLLTIADEFSDGLGLRRQGHGEHGKYGPTPPPEKDKLAAAVAPQAHSEQMEFATDTEDGITDEQLADLPHGDGSAFEEEGTVASAGEFMNPWHDEIGRFAPKGTGKRIGFDRGKADKVVESAQSKLESSRDYLDEAYRVHYEQGEERESTFSQALTRYLQYGSTDMDRQLRKNGDAKVVDAAHRRALLDATVLDEAMARGGYRTPNEEIVMLRGITGENAGKIVEGMRFTDHGFVSVTASPGEAAQAAGKRAGGVLVALRIPPHTRALAGSELQQELILPRGGEYTVRSVTPGKDGQLIAEVDVRFPAKPPVTPGLPTAHDMVAEVSRQRQRKLQKERPLAASAGVDETPDPNAVYARLAWDQSMMLDSEAFITFPDGAAKPSHPAVWTVVFPVTTETARFANPWHDEIGRFAPKGTGHQGKLDAEKLLAGDRIALADLGVPHGTPEQVKLTTDTRDDDALWATAEPRQVSARDRFVGSEESVKTGPVRKVVLGGEPFRPGYPPRLYELPDGSYLVADGHHRIVMHKLLDTPSFDAIVLPYPKDKP